MIAFASAASNLVSLDNNGLQDVFIKDLTSGATLRVSTSTFGLDANALSTLHGISDDGDVIAFTSAATNVVPADGNGVSDVFVHTRSSGLTQRASTDANGAQGDAVSRHGRLSGNGRLVAFISAANNLAGPIRGCRSALLKTCRRRRPQLTSAASGILQLFDFNSSGARICFKWRR